MPLVVVVVVVVVYNQFDLTIGIEAIFIGFSIEALFIEL